MHLYVFVRVCTYRRMCVITFGRVRANVIATTFNQFKTTFQCYTTIYLTSDTGPDEHAYNTTISVIIVQDLEPRHQPPGHNISPRPQSHVCRANGSYGFCIVRLVAISIDNVCYDLQQALSRTVGEYRWQ